MSVTTPHYGGVMDDCLDSDGSSPIEPGFSPVCDSRSSEWLRSLHDKSINTFAYPMRDDYEGVKDYVK